MPASFTRTSSRNGAANARVVGENVRGMVMAKDVLLLSDLIGGRADFLELVCDRCGRRGRLSMARLAQEYAPDTPLPTIMWAKVGDCPHRNARQERERCDPYSPTLLGMFGGFCAL
jgi:hypothetical protein